MVDAGTKDDAEGAGVDDSKSPLGKFMCASFLLCSELEIVHHSCRGFLSALLHTHT